MSPHALTSTPLDPVLVIPDGWVIDRSSQARLTARLERAGSAVAGVVALRGDVPPGASYRVASERIGLASHSPHRAVTGRGTRGAALLRPGVAFEVGENGVDVDDDRLLVDPGAMAHDPWRPLDAIEHASPLGRPPFPYRPVVVFLGFDPDPDLADWVRATVNALVRGSTEGRIAVPEPTGGLHLTRPCSPTEESIVALVPDVVVALDPTAVELGSRWLGGERSAVIIELTQDTTAAVALVSWRIGHAQGRLRARIGRGIAASALALLVRRLSAGPQPVPPDGRRPPGLHVRRRRPARGTLSLLALTGGTPASGRVRLDGLADHAAAVATMTVRTIEDRVPGEARTADLVLLRDLCRSESVYDLVRERRQAGRPTVVDVGPLDLQIEPGPPERGLSLAPRAERLVQAAGAATTTSRHVRDLLQTSGVRAHVLPTLLTRVRWAQLRTAREWAPAGLPVLGWYTGSGRAGAPSAASPPSTVPGLLAMLATLLETMPELTIEIVGEGTEIAGPLRSHERVTPAPGPPAVDVIARWTAQVWTGSRLGAGDDLRPVIEAHALGVPTMVDVDSPAAHEGLVVAALTVDGNGGADGWSALLELLGDGPERARRSDEATQLAEALYGPASSAAVLNRFIGWLQFAGTS